MDSEYTFEELVAIMARLRAPDGCPWDREQTHETLKSYLIEESHEVLDAIDDGSDSGLCEELGDVLLQIVFHGQIAEEEGRFSTSDIVNTLSRKLVRRHPHVFGDVEVSGSAEVLANWESIKSEEKKDSGEDPSVLDGVPRSLPGLLRAQRTQEKAAKVGFEWSDQDEVNGKLKEEVEEFLDVLRSEDRARQEEELGDILFSIVNVARFLGLQPEEALKKTVEKFTTRFGYIEKELRKCGKDPQGASIEEMDALWEESKNR